MIENNLYSGIGFNRFEPPIDPMRLRMEMIMSRGLGIIAPDFIMPKFELEPFTEDDFKQAFIGTDWGIKPRANTSKLRAINRKHKVK